MLECDMSPAQSVSKLRGGHTSRVHAWKPCRQREKYTDRMAQIARGRSSGRDIAQRTTEIASCLKKRLIAILA